jgi:D-alanyl-D-alanine carboxypeptidase/D-alanyl-D-alanine-endopeptidase (penicillin-binding protein 4)
MLAVSRLFSLITAISLIYLSACKELDPSSTVPLPTDLDRSGNVTVETEDFLPQETEEADIATDLFPPISPENPDPTTNAKIQVYLDRLEAQGFSKDGQGVWIQTQDQLLANHQGTVPLPAASLTKVATTLAALETFGPDYRFTTIFGTNGTIQNGRLDGDLVIQGGEDPFFVWEEAIAVGNLLNEMGIRSISGNLIISGRFYMNYKENPLEAGELLKQSLNANLWGAEASAQHQTLPAGTARPNVVIEGSVSTKDFAQEQFIPLVKHNSLPLAELLKKMNQYSNNAMADMFAKAVGGASIVAKKSAEAAGFPQNEISLINGSGLGMDNRISPRAVCAMFLSIENILKPYKMSVSDVFVVIGKDPGILEPRQLPQLAIVKSGSLDSVSAVAGALPTQEQGTVWFSIINVGNNLTGFRSEQENLLEDFSTEWGLSQSLPQELSPNPQRLTKTSLVEIID